ncbi:hypothetical protein F5882DRAFT_23046 [Hyaloscypha sp. PMI_1271]|nr:hypothetical protein F5882DRAFT_23046 [Hyaloscypha sp. PMI_1271]
MGTSKRKWAPKGRGGCSTCKSRHVRCDTVQPRCTPCQKSSRQCQYSSIPEPDALKIVLWQPNFLVLHRISQTPCHTGAEARAFDFFRTKVAIDLSGFFDSSFWTHDILQAAQEEGPVRHAIVALASLSETILDKSPESLERCPKAFAIRQHTKAISDLNQKIQEGNESSVEVVLMTCALFVCFEMFQNNYEAALNHMSSGIYVLFNWISKGDCSNRQSREMAIQLERVFGRLMLQTLLFVHTKPGEWKFVKPAFTPALPSIPSVLRSVDEARDCLDSCMCSLYHGMLTSQLQSLGDSDLDTGPASQLSATTLGTWSRSFRAFMTERKEELSTREQRVAILLEIQYITATILASAGPSSQEMIFDSFEVAFSRIIALASRLLISSTSGHSLEVEQPLIPAFDMGILPHLYLVSSRCRHPLLRRQALRLLRQGPRQEGIWHREMLASIAQRVINMEERNCEGAQSAEEIPASARLTVINATIDSARRTVILHCCWQEAGQENIEVVHELVEY